MKNYLSDTGCNLSGKTTFVKVIKATQDSFSDQFDCHTWFFALTIVKVRILFTSANQHFIKVVANI